MFQRRRGLSLRSYDKFFKSPLIGVDEVGTGAIAGPIFAAGVVLPAACPWVLDALEKLGLRDSKRMGIGAKNRVYEILTSEPRVQYWVEHRLPIEIEEQGHYECLGSMFNDILTNYTLACGQDGSMIVDGQQNRHVKFRVEWVEGGDDKSMAVAAASVLAKIARDKHMESLAEHYPDWGFEKHKGYLTRDHQQALEKYGVCDEHRKNTDPVKKIIALRKSRPEVLQTSEKSNS